VIYLTDIQEISDIHVLEEKLLEAVQYLQTAPIPVTQLVIIGKPESVVLTDIQQIHSKEE
jgi:hypothetical protein